MMASEEKYLLLLQRSFKGELTPEERSMLSQWRQAAPENEQLACTYTLIWERSTEIAPLIDLDVEGDFKQMLGKMAPVPLSRTIPLHGWRRRWVSIAAVFFFLIAAVWMYRFYTLPAASDRIEMAGNTVPYRLIDLPDGSKVWLRGGSSLEFPAHFANAERRLHLKGEAFFEVSHQPERPFRVLTEGGGIVEVLGTAFNLRSSGGNAEQSVLVKTGKVRFSPVIGTEGVVLTAGMRAAYHPAKRQISLAEHATLNELSWKTGGLEFIRTPLQEVISDLERHYSVQIELRNPAMAHCLHTAPLTNQTVDKVLQGLSLVYKFQVEHPEKDRYILIGGGCH